MIGTTLQNRYRLESLLGRGGMGEVYRARDTRLHREVAVKVVRGQAFDTEARQRLVHEARAAAALNHPGIVAVHDAGEDGEPFVVMELVPGRSLRETEIGGLPEIVEIGRQICRALAHAHAHGIVHRDLKPENVLVIRHGGRLLVKLADLGLALGGSATRLTRSGVMMGTAAYMAPEQALGGAVDGRTDLYALGAILYELATGQPPFPGDDPIAVVSQHLHAPVVPPRTYRPELPPAFEGLVLRLLAKRPEDRFGSAEEAEAALATVPLSGEAPAPADEAETDAVRLLEQLVRGRMVGRRAQLAELRELWSRSERGQGHLALVSGEPGVGKTRLARELAVYARLQGAWVLQGGCYEFEATTPYLPFVEALRSWVRDRDPKTLRRLVGPLATELAKLAPEIEDRLGPLSANPPLSPAEERLRLFDHVGRFVQALASDRGVLLVLDDLHWADHGSLALLHFLVRQARESRLLVLGAYREAELDRTHPLQKALVEWNRERLATRVPLGRLSLEDTSAMLAVLFGQSEVSPDFATALYHETEGNPFFIEEVIKALIEQGQIYREGGEWQRQDVHELAIPQSIKAAVSRRLERLSPTCNEVLQTAAALGKIFDFEELSATVAVAEDPLLDALDEASASQLIRSEGAESFAFTHDKIREVLHEELNPIRQRRLHQRIGESLEALYGERSDAHAEDLAYHFVRSGDLRKALVYSRQAGERAERLYALEEALDFYERARECAETLELVPELSMTEERIGMVWNARGDAGPAVEHFERALALERSPERRLSIQSMIGEVYGRVGDPRGLPLLEGVLKELDEARQPADVARALGMVGRYYHYRGQHHEAIRHLERALELAKRAQNHDLVGSFYSYMCGAYQNLTRYRESNEWARHEIELGERFHRPADIALGHEFLGENAANQGHFDEALTHAALDREWGEKIQSQERQAWSEFTQAWALHGKGDLARARSLGESGLARGRRIGEHRVAMFIEIVLSWTFCDLGAEDEARRYGDSALRESARLGLAQIQMVALYSLAYLDLCTGAWEKVLERWEEVERILEGRDTATMPMFFAPMRAEALARLERSELAERVVEDGLARARAAEAPIREGLGLRAKGLVLASRDPVAAEEAFTHAADILARLGAQLPLARTLMDRGRLRAMRGDTAAARRDVTSALELATECGAVRDRARAEEALRTLERGGDPAPSVEA